MRSLLFQMACCRPRISFTFLYEAMDFLQESYYERDDTIANREFMLSEGLRKLYQDIGSTVIQFASNWDAPLYDPKKEMIDSIVRGYGCSGKGRGRNRLPAKRKYSKRYYDDLEDAAWERENDPYADQNDIPY